MTIKSSEGEAMLKLATRFERSHMLEETPDERHLVVKALRAALAPHDKTEG